MQSRHVFRASPSPFIKISKFSIKKCNKIRILLIPWTFIISSCILYIYIFMKCPTKALLKVLDDYQGHQSSLVLILRMANLILYILGVTFYKYNQNDFALISANHWSSIRASHYFRSAPIKYRVFCNYIGNRNSIYVLPHAQNIFKVIIM